MTLTQQDIIRNEFRKLLRSDNQRNIDEKPLAELGVDSLDFFEALMILEDDHGIIIPVQELHGTITLGEIFQMIK